MPVITTAWDRLEIEDSELEPAALAKVMAHLDIDDEENEQEGVDDETSVAHPLRQYSYYLLILICTGPKKKTKMGTIYELRTIVSSSNVKLTFAVGYLECAENREVLIG